MEPGGYQRAKPTVSQPMKISHSLHHDTQATARSGQESTGCSQMLRVQLHTHSYQLCGLEQVA